MDKNANKTNETQYRLSQKKKSDWAEALELI